MVPTIAQPASAKPKMVTPRGIIGSLTRVQHQRALCFQSAAKLGQ